MRGSSLPRSALAATVLVVVASTAPAEAQNKPYGVLALVNKSDRVVQYSYWWGNHGTRAQASLAPGYYHLYSWRYDPARPGHAPDFHVSFATGSGRPGVADMTLKQYTLTKYQAWRVDFASAFKHTFRVTRSGMVELYASG